MHLLNQSLKALKTCKRVSTLIKLAFIIFCLLITLNCGKRKPPQPPVEKVAQRTEISGYQRGNQVFLSWMLPPKNASDKNLSNIERVDIYRLAEPQSSSLTLSEEEFASNSTLIASVPVSGSDVGEKKLFYTDILELSGAATRLRYAIRFVNSFGQKAAFSNILLIEPAAKIAESPDLKPAAVSENAIKLSWNAPKTNVDGTSPANILGYNVYRSLDSEDSQKILNNSPLMTTEFLDSSFEFGKNYTYFVRAVSIGGSGEPVESLDSNKISVLPKDVFAPSAPTAITVAAAPNSISIFFAVNPEKDIAGYQIYRTTDAGLPKTDWLLLTSELLKTNTFQDKAVESGKTYFYYLTAVDNAGNVSQPSAVVSESVP